MKFSTNIPISQSARLIVRVCTHSIRCRHLVRYYLSYGSALTFLEGTSNPTIRHVRQPVGGDLRPSRGPRTASPPVSSPSCHVSWRSYETILTPPTYGQRRYFDSSRVQRGGPVSSFLKFSNPYARIALNIEANTSTVDLVEREERRLLMFVTRLVYPGTIGSLTRWVGSVPQRPRGPNAKLPRFRRLFKYLQRA